MIGNTLRCEPSQSRLTACQLPRKGELFCVAARFACPGVAPYVKMESRSVRRRSGFPKFKIMFSYRPAPGQAFSEGLLRSTLRMILRTGRMLLAFMDSSSTPMRRKVSVRAVSAPSSPQMPTQMPWR